MLKNDKNKQSLVPNVIHACNQKKKSREPYMFSQKFCQFPDKQQDGSRFHLIKCKSIHLQSVTEKTITCATIEILKRQKGMSLNYTDWIFYGKFKYNKVNKNKEYLWIHPFYFEI